MKRAPATETSAEVASQGDSQPLHIKYRPASLKYVVGQKAVVSSLEKVLTAKARPHVFLFTGPRGTGKTTLARIIAARFGCDTGNLVEVDAASNSGIDDMRAVTSALRYTGFGDTPNKAIIIDECHGLSKQAWDSLLKTTEDTPPHVYFFFCSTNPGKIPETMVSRCAAYNLALLKFDDLMDILEETCDREGYKTSSRVLQLVAKACEGSARAALTMLAVVHDCDEDEAAVLLQSPLDNKEVIDLCRLMVKGDLQWQSVVSVLKDLADMPPESIRIVIVNYLNACIMGSRKADDTVRLLVMLERFLTPCNPADKLAPLLVAFGRFVYP